MLMAICHDFGVHDFMTSRFSLRALTFGALLLTSAAPRWRGALRQRIIRHLA